jgi:NhaA family Na+:H+ antiporter
MKLSGWLDRPVDPQYDHVLGPADAEITLVEYGSYACPYCRAANEQIAETRDRFGERLRYVFRHRPLTGNDLARRAAELAESARDPEQFWKAHVALMTRSEMLTEDDLRAVANDLGLADRDAAAAQRARQRVEADEASARRSDVMVTPSFFVNGRRYDGAWDAGSMSDAMLGTLGHRVRAAALDFASWGPSAGVLLLLATILAIVLTNAPLGAAFESFWETSLVFSLGGFSFGMSLRHWVNDALLTIFFLVVGLEIKREFTVGRLASPRSAMLPIAGAIGGMAVPAALYGLIIPTGPWAHGWGVPMATDTAFAVALIALIGRRAPVELRIFLTAAAIVDDIGAIIVVALYYSGALNVWLIAAAAIVTGMLAWLNSVHVYRLSVYLLVGVVLWACILGSGLHATLAGVVLALFIPTRPAPDLPALSAGRRDHRRRGAPRPRGAAAWAVGAGNARAGGGSRAAGVARGPAFASRRCAVELSGAAGLRPGQCRRRDFDRHVGSAPVADARHHGGPRDRQAGRHAGSHRSRGPLRHCHET